jgi:hypothetical protein
MNQLQTNTDEYNERFIKLLVDRGQLEDVFIIRELDACDACRVAPQSLAAADLPVLPHRGCKRRAGCGCWYAASSRTFTE